ncbi:hypothetical protein PQQ87_08755 [Paraburkholderia nemoris]|uniref:hypothetical protein n=1 Tax=Paraburkholderia nemoris TaxID=2793076 RepID=UPI0038B98C23
MNFATEALTWKLPTTVNYASDKIDMSVGDTSTALTFAELAARSDWSDFTLYAVRFNPVVDPGKVILPGVTNVFAHTAIGKRTVGELGRDMNTSLLIQVFVPHRKVKSFDECNVLFATTTDVTSNVPLADIEPNSGKWRKQFTGLALTGPATVAPGAVATIGVQLTDSAGKPLAFPVAIELEASAGYLNKRRLQLDAKGQGAVQVRADLLGAGDKITIKAGYRYYSGVGAITLGVQ